MVSSGQRLSKRSSFTIAGFAALASLLTGAAAAAPATEDGKVIATNSRLSDQVRAQIVDKLLQGTRDADAEVANHCLDGLAPVANAETATQALLAILDRPAVTKGEMLEKLYFSCCLLANGISRDQVVASVLDAATTSEHAVVRFRAINILAFAAAGNTSADVVRMFVATVENPESTSHPATSATTAAYQLSGSPKENRWSPNHPVVKALITRAAGHKDESDLARSEKKIAGFVTATRSAAESRDQAEFAELVEAYNHLVKQDRWSEAELIARQAKEIAPGNPVTVIMSEKARIGRHVYQNAHLENCGERDRHAANDVLQVEKRFELESLAPAALSAIAHIVPQTDEVAIALIEAVNHKDLRIRRAATIALANAVGGSPAGASSAK
jgi:hypothetical protein